MHHQRPLLELSEADVIWVGIFAETLRRLSPALAADGKGMVADRLAREAFEDEALRLLPAEQAAPYWWEERQKSMR